MMIPDAILDEIGKYILRTLYFALLSIGLGFLTFVKATSSSLEGTFTVLPQSLVIACVPGETNLISRIACLALGVGILLTTVIFMLLGRWWHRRSELPRRGARLDVERDRK